MATDFLSHLYDRLYAGSLYRLTLRGRSPRSLVHAPPPSQGGDPVRGRRILEGTLSCAGRTFDARRPAWHDVAAGPAALGELHGFAYLRDLATLGEAGRVLVRSLVASWLADGSRWNSVGWAPEILGARVAEWLTHLPLLLDGSDNELGLRALASLAQQARHLGRTVSSGRAGAARLQAIKGLVYAAGSGVIGQRALARGMSALRQEIARQVREDGVHAERSPAAQYQALAALVDIRAMLETAAFTVPAVLSSAISQMTPMLRFFRHGDGGFALFNGASEGEVGAVDGLLARANVKGAPLPGASASGFQRLAAGSLLLIQDAGAPPRPGFDAMAHAGTLSFEASYGRDRMIVNCGTARGSIGEALRATAAHSTVVVEDINSTEILSDRLGRRPGQVECTRDDMDGNAWTTASHNGYAERFGLSHRRRLYLSAGGDNLRGEDMLVPTTGAEAESHSFTVRFHLHPAVQASLIHNGAAVLLRLPSGVGWRFQCGGGVPRIEESVYFSDPDSGRRTRQIAISGVTHRSGAVIKWAFQRVSAN